MSYSRKSMVIGAGLFKGLKILAPEGLGSRPTKSIARAGFLNSVHQELAGSRFLDLFAGTGAVGIEAVSRGAVSCIFVENSPKAVVALKSNLAEVERRFVSQNLEVSNLEIVSKPVEQCWQKISSLGPFDLVWADPPYEMAAEAIPMMLENLLPLVSSKGCFFVETGDKLAITDFVTDGWNYEKTKSYGITRIHKFQKTN